MDELGQTRMNPLAASLVVGTIDVVARAPFENVKIALQGGGSASNVLRNARAMGPQTLWRGLGATLVRDLPYTVLFWTSVAALRASVAPADASADNGGGNGMFLNFACGAVAGAFAATLVTPQDAIKTRMQLAAHRNLAFSTAAPCRNCQNGLCSLRHARVVLCHRSSQHRTDDCHRSKRARHCGRNHSHRRVDSRGGGHHPSRPRYGGLDR